MTGKKKQDFEKSKATVVEAKKAFETIGFSPDVVIYETDTYDRGIDLIYNGKNVDVKAHEKPRKVNKFKYCPVEISANGRAGWYFSELTDIYCIVNNFDYNTNKWSEMFIFERKKLTKLIRQNNYHTRTFYTEKESGTYIMVPYDDLIKISDVIVYDDVYKK